MSEVRERVRARYAEAALATPRASCGSSACCGELAADEGEVPGSAFYEDAERRAVPQTALLASLGCGNPTAVADLRKGETVLDLGSGAGLDVLLSARRVGRAGKVFGLDMTDEMLAVAERNRKEAGVDNVEFLKGYIEAIPLAAASVDTIISNCVINLSVDKGKVFAETHRVLRPGGRLAISDIVAADDLPTEQRGERGSYEACIAGALSFAEYREGLRAAGFEDIEIAPTHEVADRMFGAIIRATKRGGAVSPGAASAEG